MKLRLVSAAAVTCVVSLSSFASAQDAGTPPPAAPAKGDDGRTDHSRFVGRFAVGYFGTAGVSVRTADWNAGGCGISNNNMPAVPCWPVLGNAQQVDAPVIGIRYWINERFGIDGGIGLGLYSGSVESYTPNNPATSAPLKYKQDKVSLSAFVFHVGVPIALATAKHFTFEAIPEINLGFASGSIKDQVPPVPAGATAPQARSEIKLSGFLLDIGGRIGGELHFGFIGVPELSVLGTVGLAFSTRKQSATVSGNTASNSDTTIGTSVQDTPFGIFSRNISALYYF